MPGAQFFSNRLSFLINFQLIPQADRSVPEKLRTEDKREI